MSHTIYRTSGERRPTGLLLWILLLVALGAFIWSGINYWQTSRELAVLTNPKLASQLNEKETAELLAKIGKLMDLPKEKNPIVATINDAETLATTQDFYAMAHNGDRLVIYKASKKAIIYDEEANKIVNVGPIFYNTPEAEAAATARPDQLAIEIRNGTTNAGAGADLRDRLEGNNSYNVVKLGKAVNTNYPSTIIVDSTGGAKAELVTSLAKQLGGAQVVTVVPEGESPARSEILVIVGAK